ncbi:hypothetical protein V8F33_010714 [Rhypophila sp. PSN 637]
MKEGHPWSMSPGTLSIRPDPYNLMWHPPSQHRLCKMSNPARHHLRCRRDTKDCPGNTTSKADHSLMWTGKRSTFPRRTYTSSPCCMQEHMQEPYYLGRRVFTGVRAMCAHWTQPGVKGVMENKVRTELSFPCGGRHTLSERYLPNRKRSRHSPTSTASDSTEAKPVGIGASASWESRDQHVRTPRRRELHPTSPQILWKNSGGC